MNASAFTALDPRFNKIGVEGKVVLITGASSGIGYAAARRFAEAGAKLVLTGQRADRLQALAKETGRAAFRAGDICHETLCDELVDLAIEKFGRIDIVLNNAGVNHGGTIDAIEIEKVAAMVRVNVEAAYRLSYRILKYFKSRGVGHLINTSSVMGTKVRATSGPYAGTKHAIEALSEALRLELAGSGIKVSCVEPGLVSTELHRDWKTPPAIERGIARPLLADEVAQAILYIACQPAHINVARMLVLPQDHCI